MPDTHLPPHDARTATERLFPTLRDAQIARIWTHGYRHPHFFEFAIRVCICLRVLMKSGLS